MIEGLNTFGSKQIRVGRNQISQTFAEINQCLTCQKFWSKNCLMTQFHPKYCESTKFLFQKCYSLQSFGSKKFGTHDFGSKRFVFKQFFCPQKIKAAKYFGSKKSGLKKDFRSKNLFVQYFLCLVKFLILNILDLICPIINLPL